MLRQPHTSYRLYQIADMVEKTIIMLPKPREDSLLSDMSHCETISFNVMIQSLDFNTCKKINNDAKRNNYTVHRTVYTKP